MKRSHCLDTLRVVILIVLVQSLSHAEILNEENACTWGIANSDLPIPSGSIITDAVITLHNVSKVRADSQTALSVHLLDNPEPGVLEIPDGQPGNYFDGYGSLLRTFSDMELTATPQDITIDLKQADDPDSWVWQIYSQVPVISLADSTTVEFDASSLLTLLEYTGTGRSFGFGIDCDGVSVSAVSLSLTIQSATEMIPPTTLSFFAGNLNSAPVLDPIMNVTINEMETMNFSVSATDADSDNLTYSATNLPEGADFTGATFTWTPTMEQSGTYEVAFIADDGALSDSQTATLTVLNVNQPPILAAIGEKSLSERQQLTFNVTATDPDNDLVTFTCTGLPNGAVFINGSFAWTPDYEQAGNYLLTVTASDGTLINSETISITVNPTNRAPVIEAIADQTITVSKTLTFTVSGSDPDRDAVSLSAESLPQGAVFENGSFTWTPTDIQVGTCQVTFVANDGNGEVDTVTVQITAEAAPVNWTQLAYDDFETGWGRYTDGGRDCKLDTRGRYAHQGNNAANIQDNSNTSSSFYLTNGIDVSGYSEIKIEFWYMARSMDNSSENFRLDFWDGSRWTTLKTWAQGIDFQNNQFFFENLVLSKLDYNFSPDMRIRFVCDASNNYDDIYIDEINISAK